MKAESIPELYYQQENLQRSLVHNLANITVLASCSFSGSTVLHPLTNLIPQAA